MFVCKHQNIFFYIKTFDLIDQKNKRGEKPSRRSSRILSSNPSHDS